MEDGISAHWPGTLDFASQGLFLLHRWTRHHYDR